MNIEIKAPNECSDEELQAFCRIVRDAGEVTPVGLAGRVKRARLLAFAIVDGASVGVAALKVPTQHHLQEVFDEAKALVKPDDFKVSGWATHVDRRQGEG